MIKQEIHTKFNKTFLLKLHQNAGRGFYSQKKSFFAQQMLKKNISTSVWSAQPQNAGRNIQQSGGHQKNSN